ncbi:hypothetical protein E2562_022723 [Oryza meyeriana var. granulata]|uniref:DUF834 domain-containing protein n=1 Tax=Oryza meyeriana var. granulata TaxID=110450 RepID=A0A6G1E0P8_9ORYZ|nr:hypothetical protein E2562_022723 [Oryza meyeriana var. granulata]
MAAEVLECRRGGGDGISAAARVPLVQRQGAAGWSGHGDGEEARMDAVAMRQCLSEAEGGTRAS